jgi:acyl-coenzyme A synthetase/AMP-(fatty) acid ligase/aryl carrier-like protein
LWWGQQSHPLAGSDVALLLARPTSDFAYWEMLAPLSAGASLAIQRARSPLGPSDIAAACAENQVTVMHQVPSLLAENMTDAAFRQAIGRLRILYVGGEALPITLAQRLAESATTLVNQYGPAETCIDVTSHWCEDHPYVRTPIGRPAPGVVVRILDASLRPVPRGSVGELWLGGPCLAYGYPGAPAITAASFLPDPYAQEPGARIYRTGDMARELANGVLDLVGRADRQLKIRGARVEPGEIESALLLHPAVRRAAAVPTSDGLLQAYAETTEVTATELAAFLRSRVPSERLPASVITRASLPLLASGKLDRHALDETAADIASSGTAAGLTVDPVIAEVWARTLKLPPDSVDDDSDFFSSGGGSLEAIRLAAALREFGYSSSIRTVFESPRLADFVQNVCRLSSS